MKYIFILLVFVTSCGPSVKIDYKSHKYYQHCDKLCKDKYGEESSVSFVGFITGDCYCE